MAMKAISKGIKWDFSACKHCELCIQFCPIHNLEFKDNKLIDKGKCSGCGICEKYCPDFGIMVIKEKE